MLGENHSLLNDFPEYQETIARLIKEDETFATENKKYTELDKRIRTLELNNTPTDDETIHEMKQERANLKDILYKKLKKNN